MKRLLVSLVVLVGIVSVLAAGCATSAPTPAPTTAPPAPAKAAAPQPTAAPAAKPTAAPAAQPTAAPAAQPTAVPAKKVAFPEKGKTINIIVGWAAGTSTDTGIRLLAPAIEKDLGVPIQVVNKPGASGQIGMTELVQSKPDGYTLAALTLPATIANYLLPDMKAVFTRKDMAPVVLYDWDPSVMAVKGDSRFKTVKDVFDAAKANPEKVTASTSGPLSSHQVQVLQWQKAANVKFAMVQFDGGGPAMTAMVGGHIDLFAGTVSGATSQQKSGAARVLAVMDKEPSRYLPGVPTMESQGYKIYSYSSRGLVAPAGTPKEIIDILAGSVQKAMRSDEFQKKFESMGLTARYMGPDDSAAFWVEREAEMVSFLKEIGTK